jgi:hypothetical protein
MYIDPNTGGIIFQALAVAFTAISGFVLVFSGRIKLWFANMRRKMRGDDSAKPTESADTSEE